MRSILLCLGFICGGALAAPAPFSVIADELDPNAPASSLPSGPVDQALALAREGSARLVVLAPRREGTQGGVRYALAAWRADPASASWDALLVLALPEGARSIEASSEAKDVPATLTALLEYAQVAPPPAARVLPPPVADAPLPMPERFDARFLVLLERAPGYAAGDEKAEAALTERHIQYQLRMMRDGVSIAAGPFAADAGSGALVGATLLRVRDLAAARALAEADPAVVAGRLKATVREWKYPAGRLP